jgi:2-enoate reductase
VVLIFSVEFLEYRPKRGPAMSKKYSQLFESINICACEIKNRFAMSPMGNMGLADTEGGWTRQCADYFAARARGGVGLIITGTIFSEFSVESKAFPSYPCPTRNPTHFVRTSREMVERVHAYDTRIFPQIGAGYGRVVMNVFGEGYPMAPSAIPYYWDKNTICKEMTKEEIRQIIKSFAQAALICKRAGFDGIEVHALHEGYLLDQFAISYFNNRTDEYGGSLENRLRFSTEIVEEVKALCGADFPVIMRYSVKSYIKEWGKGAVPGEVFEELGRDIDESVEVLKHLAKCGYDGFNVDAGSYDSWYWAHPPMYHEKGVYLPLSAICKKAVDKTIITAGRMDNPDTALEAVRNGLTDMIGLGRPLLADPEIVNKIENNERERIRPCLSCHEGCMGRLKVYGLLACAVNPLAVHEEINRIVPSVKKKRVVIVGGGPAGCEAARVARLKGHEVILFERSQQLGGKLIPGGAPRFKEDDIALAKWYTLELKDLGVDIRFNIEVDLPILQMLNADEIIIATGSFPKLLHFTDDEKVYTAETILLKEKDPGDETIVIGGGLVGCETALMLAQEGRRVSIVEMLPDILSTGAPLAIINREMLCDMLTFNKVNIFTGARIEDVSQGAMVITQNGTVKRLNSDSVILAVGYKESRKLYQEAKKSMKNVRVIGDARKVSNIHYAIWEGFEVANSF